MSRERLKVCKNCETVHVIVRGFRDKNPSCYKCGGSDFINPDPKEINELKKGHTPVFCDWRLQNRVERTSEKLAEFIASRHGKLASPELLDDLKQYLVFAANCDRHNFVLSNEAFTKFSRK